MMCEDDSLRDQLSEMDDPSDPERTFVEDFYEFVTYELRTKNRVQVWPPLELTTLFEYKEKRDAPLLTHPRFKLPQYKHHLTSKTEMSWGDLYDAAFPHIVSNVLCPAVFIARHGIVAKPVFGTGGNKVVHIVKTTAGVTTRHRQQQTYDAKLVSGGTAATYPNVICGTTGMVFTFEAFIPDMKESEHRCYAALHQAGKVQSVGYINTQNLGDGTLRSGPTVQCFTPQAKMHQTVSTINKYYQSQVPNVEWKKHRGIILRYDMFSVTNHAPTGDDDDDELWLVNEVELFPFASTFITDISNADIALEKYAKVTADYVFEALQHPNL